LQSEKLTSIEDLFETQRRELFSRIIEMEKTLTNKYSTMERAVVQIAQKTTDIDPSQLFI